MKIGTFARLGERTLDGRTPRLNDIKELALAAEAVGLDSFWLSDHLIFFPPDDEPIGCWETFTFLGALASVTNTIALGPFVAASLFRNPALLAKMADSLDEIAGGRVILGLGAGNWEAEHTRFGYPFDHRAGRFAEAIEIIAPLLRAGRVDFHGRYYDATDCVLRPRGPSPGGPPIWIGARGERMLRLIARHADAYNIIWPLDAADVTARWERMAAICAEEGRDPATLALTAGTFVRLPGSDATDDGPAISGTEEEIAARLRALAAAGVAHLIVDFRPSITVREIERFGRVLALLR